ncbi:protein eva-1 homolog C isoform X6 [Eubalaena glacialis]|uniref:protein eva-1 homolog C isoform X6 n=1 Tax=Eubalaena glacialis TaxID=27606 RepID=UPI002A59B1FC|nr:protein eva-1 homolog C isoform X6 [Eubalaena glacialis]
MLLPGHARPPPAPQPAQHPGLRRQAEPPGQLLRLFYCTVLVCSKEISALTDFSGKKRPPSLCDPGAAGRPGYLTKLLQNHTAYACDGDRLDLQCPRHSTISVQSAFYGHDYQTCSAQQPASQREDSLACVAPTTLQKVLDECQNQRTCHLLVNSRVFGPDLCPGSSKYLLVSFKCQPNELKNKTVCEDHELKLHCHESKFLNIYSATYGRKTQERDVCSSEATWLPPFVPKNILTAIDPAVANLKPSVKQKDGDYGINFDPRKPRVLRKDGVMVSHSLAAFAYLRGSLAAHLWRDRILECQLCKFEQCLPASVQRAKTSEDFCKIHAHPERAALLFVSSVCIGLALTLCALVIRVSCTKDFRELQLAREHLVPGSDKAEEDSQDEEAEEDSSDSDLPGELSGFRRTTYPVCSSIEAAELAERIERREQIIQEIWMNSGLDTSLPRNMGQFY